VKFNKNYSSKLSKSFDDEDEPMESSTGYFVETQSFHEFTVPIDNDFGPPSQYRAVVQMLLNASEDDSVVYLINSRGGRMDGLQTLLEATKMCKAQTTAVILGECASAASILALTCDSVHVTESSSMLCHSVSMSTGGKHSDVVAHLAHMTKTTHNLMRKTYEGFLTEDELSSMLDGREIFLDANDIIEHLEQREEYQEQKLILLEEMKAQQEALDNPKVSPKPKATKKTTPKKA